MLQKSHHELCGKKQFTEHIPTTTGFKRSELCQCTNTCSRAHISLMLHRGKFSLLLNIATAEKRTWAQREEGFIHRLWQRECPKDDCLLLLKVQWFDSHWLKTATLWSTVPFRRPDQHQWKQLKTHHRANTGQCWSQLLTSEKKSLSLHLRRTQFDRSWL